MADITTTINSTTIQTVFGDGVAQAQLAAHVALTAGAHGISAYGATLVDDADAAAARNTLGLGTAATTAATDYATAAQGLLADSAVQGKASLTNVGRLTRVTAAGTIGEALVAEDGAGNVTGLLSAAASSSAGGSLKSNNGTTCISWGAGGGANASTADGLAVGGALTVAASATITGTLTAIAAATQDAVRLQGRAGGTGSWVASITPTTLTASRTITIPNLDGTLALTGATQAVSFGTLSSTAITSTGGVAVGGALSGATTGSFSDTISITGASAFLSWTAGTGRISALTTLSYRAGAASTHEFQVGGVTIATLSATLLNIANSAAITANRATFAGTDATTVPANQVTMGGGVVRAAGAVNCVGLTSTGGVAVGGALTGATTGGFSGAVSVGGDLTVSRSANGLVFADLVNASTGTSALTAYRSRNDASAEVVVTMAGSAFSGNRFGVPRANTAFVGCTTAHVLNIGTAGAAAVVFGTADVARMTIAATGEISATSTTASTSTTTGALTVAGGVGIAGRCAVNNMSLVDGITAPATQAGHAILYVDSADGDLKIKFGDGTVKTIVTDT
jgi:hypothetical protein